MDDDEYSRLGEELYAENMPNVPTGPIFPRVPTTIPMPKHVITSRDELIHMRTRAYDKYVDVMHKTLQGFSKLTNCIRTKQVNDGVAKIKELIQQINDYDERLKSMAGGKRSNKQRRTVKRGTAKRGTVRNNSRKDTFVSVRVKNNI